MLWELISVLHQSQPYLEESDTLKKLKERLIYFFNCGCLSFCKGINFNGDESKVETIVKNTFIQSQTWNGINQASSNKLIKVYIT